MLISDIGLSNMLVNRMWPSIYDVHTEGKGVRLRWTHVDGGEGVQPHVDVHTEN